MFEYNEFTGAEPAAEENEEADFGDWAEQTSFQEEKEEAGFEQWAEIG